MWRGEHGEVSSGYRTFSSGEFSGDGGEAPPPPSRVERRLLFRRLSTLRLLLALHHVMFAEPSSNSGALAHDVPSMSPMSYSSAAPAAGAGDA